MRLWPLWIEEVREKFDAVGQARAGAREVAVGVHCEDAAIKNGREILPTFGNFRGVEFLRVAFCVVAAEHYQDHVGITLRDVVRRYFEGRMPCPAENVFSSCDCDHLWNPVTAYVEWIEPFEAGYARTDRGLRCGDHAGGGFRGGGRVRVSRGCDAGHGLHSCFQFDG